MKKFLYVLYAILGLVIVGLVVYDYYPDHMVETSTLTRAAILLVSDILAIVRTASRSKKEIINKKAVYSKSYPDFIGNAFSHTPKLEETFFDAVDDYNQNKPAAGIKKLTSLRKQCQSSDDIYATTIFLALCYDDIQLFEEAIKAYEDAMHLRPNSTLASNLGLCYGRMGKLDRASECYHEAIQLDGNNPFPYNNLAQQELRACNYDKAAEYALQALAINPQMPQVLNVMTVCSYVQGDIPAYENYYKQAVANGSDGRILKDFIKSLDATIN